MDDAIRLEDDGRWCMMADDGVCLVDDRIRLVDDLVRLVLTKFVSISVFCSGCFFLYFTDVVLSSEDFGL